MLARVIQIQQEFNKRVEELNEKDLKLDQKRYELLTVHLSLTSNK